MLFQIHPLVDVDATGNDLPAQDGVPITRLPV